ncbi:hypothetical protein LGV61_10180 [Desulfurispirillum indicum]|uniref:LPP20 lipoprotein n=1 Tax=Desulfurispirillum indicum (strain ATCC BAA-1389 / DSM 22839 / S5) TaxID=653733 RepID=E6W2U2_DESIS|nr:hypothetical protein [Desulfurispirillum indicum]ADU66767.1 hypothetical protein Selin_2047 [Desulfurispirillum indicum S5]UCZ56088.1 hypothetical protein LGV61_10180 [Desulfurispirillum indicum]
MGGKVAKIGMLLMILAVVAGCGKKAGEVLECTYPDAPTVQAPLWVCGYPVEGIEVSAVGSHPVSAAGVNFTQTMAEAAAMERLARSMQVHVAQRIQRYTETTGVGDAETVDTVNQSVSRLLTSQNLHGAKRYRIITSPANTTYVLMGLDAASLEELTRQTLQTSMNNDQAAWQQLRAQKAQEELLRELTTMP